MVLLLHNTWCAFLVWRVFKPISGNVTNLSHVRCINSLENSHTHPPNLPRDTVIFCTKCDTYNNLLSLCHTSEAFEHLLYLKRLKGLNHGHMLSDGCLTPVPVCPHMVCQDYRRGNPKWLVKSCVLLNLSILYFKLHFGLQLFEEICLVRLDGAYL